MNKVRQGILSRNTISDKGRNKTTVVFTTQNHSLGPTIQARNNQIKHQTRQTPNLRRTPQDRHRGNHP